jgi:hypothetical protein
LNRADFDRKALTYARVRKRTDCVCEVCGRQCRRPHIVENRNRPSYLIVHQDGNGQNYDDDNLALLCVRCYQ